MTIEIRKNSDGDKYEIWNDGERMLTPKGNPVDGGGHDMLDKAERQVGYIKAGQEKKAKREAEEAAKAGKE